MIPTLLKEHMYVKIAVALILLLAPIIILDYRDSIVKWWSRVRRSSGRVKGNRGGSGR